MKMGREVFEELRIRIEPLDTESLRQNYRDRKIIRGAAVKEIDVRYRWDLFYMVKGFNVVKVGTLKSDHIDTALRQIVAAL